MKSLHIWSDVPNKWGASSEWDANKHAEEHGDAVINVNSLAELGNWFREKIKWEESFDLIDFHTHGGPGEISIGGEKLNISTLTQLYAYNIDQLFNNNAQVIFNGCNVAQGFQGEFFLLKFGEMMLKGGGGKVSGNTRLGLPLFSGNPFHPFGGWVSANISIGGVAKLSNHQHLILENIKARIEKADNYISSGRLVGSNAHFIQTALNAAKKYAADPSNLNMYYACDELTVIENKLNKLYGGEAQYLRVIKR